MQKARRDIPVRLSPFGASWQLQWLRSVPVKSSQSNDRRWNDSSGSRADVEAILVLPEFCRNKFSPVVPGHALNVHGRLQLAVQKQLVRNARLLSGGSAHHAMMNVLKGSISAVHALLGRRILPNGRNRPIPDIDEFTFRSLPVPQSMLRARAVIGLPIRGKSSRATDQLKLDQNLL